MQSVEQTKSKQTYLNPEQTRVVIDVLAGRNVFVTGEAGTGKSYLIDHLCKALDQTSRVYRLLAPTGVAAINIGGMTIHKFARIFPEVRTMEDYVATQKFMPCKPWANVDVLIIDEISMVHPDIFELLGQLAQRFRHHDKVMGGLQMVLIGDFFQLPYVQTCEEKRYLFETELWQQLKLRTHVLKTPMRQHDAEFIRALNDLRTGTLSKSLKRMLRSAIQNQGVPDKHHVKLVALNVYKDRENQEKLKRLPGLPHLFTARDTGDAKYLEHCRAPKELILKAQCPVMLLRNMPEHDLCNGSIGVVTTFDANGWPVVRFNAGRTVVLDRAVWQFKQKEKAGKFTLVASRAQVPLVVAYSISVHKAQSLSLDHVEVDLNGTFCAGQMYVALSRAKTPTGLIVRNFKPEHLIVDPRILDFYKNLENH